MNKEFQDLNMEEESIKKTQMEATLKMENLGKRSGTTDARINNRIEEIEERISRIENTLEDTDKIVKRKFKKQKLLIHNMQEIQDPLKTQNQGIIGIEESKDSHLRGSKSIFNKIREESFPNLKKEMAINVQGDNRTPSRFDQKRKSSRHIIIKTLNAQKKRKNIKTCQRKRPRKV